MYRFVKVNPPFDIRVNFWDENFQVSLMSPFRELYERDESEGKRESSMWMWCIWMYCDPGVDNKLYRQPEGPRRDAIRAYCPGFDFKDPVVMACIAAYPEACMTDAKRDYDREVRGLSKFTQMIEDKLNTEELTLDQYVTIRNNRGTEQERLIKGTAKQLLELKEKAVKLFSQYEKVKGIFLQEEAQVILYGGGELGLVEEGGLIEMDDDDDY